MGFFCKKTKGAGLLDDRRNDVKKHLSLYSKLYSFLLLPFGGYTKRYLKKTHHKASGIGFLLAYNGVCRKSHK